MADKTLPTVREHADALIADMVKDGTIAPDAGAAAAAAGIPTFSKGTATLDPNTGQPVAPRQQAETPTFSEGGVSIPEGTTSGDAIGAAPVEARPATPASAAQPPEREPAPAPAQQAGTAAAEQAAEQLADAFAEYDQFEFEDPDLGVKIPLRVPKNYAETAKRGYGRRAAFDRSMSYLKNAEPVLKQMIEDGRINQVLPLIRAAIENDAYGAYVAQGFERMQKGLPLIEQARQEAAAAAQAPAPAPAFDLENEDPFFAERVRPIMDQVRSLQQTVEQQQAAQQQQQQSLAEQQRVNQWRASEMQAAHLDLARAFPDEYTGDLQRDGQIWQRAMQYAKEAGYIDAYGIRAGLVFAGQQVHLMEQERLAATASPTATALQQAEAQHMTLARAQAAAASRTVGAGAPTHAAPPAPMPRPSTTNPDGKMKPPGQYLREQQAYLAAQGQPA